MNKKRQYMACIREVMAEYKKNESIHDHHERYQMRIGETVGFCMLTSKPDWDVDEYFLRATGNWMREIGADGPAVRLVREYPVWRRA